MKKIFFQPFENYSETKLISIGLAGTLLGSLIAFAFHARFDGVLDLHFVNELHFYAPFTDNFINIIFLTIFLFIAAILTYKKTRIIDILATCILARLPYYLLSFGNINNYLLDITQQLVNITLKNTQAISIGVIDVLYIVIFALFSIVLLVYYFYLLFKGYKIATNAKGAKPIVFFIIAILLAEVSSKLSIYTLNY
ncbi:hypothetical protein SAMN04488096_10662 [Mesonia phycicola]|uniref:Yip1 domain-containing protein n=1 Tax=Mesonia phycicola TaxID=579105 RepID=A0A1M6FCE8_9FLAO|nr:hypothetical protein [Mesonia phycicola]SHI95316.1 hypothetical protein SAMN04488096_10662 [Mesonia phycicola]